MTDRNLQVCAHCGEDSTYDSIEEGYHSTCLVAIDTCKEAVREFRGFSPVDHILFIGINVLFLYGQPPLSPEESKRLTRVEKEDLQKKKKEKKEKRTIKEEELLKYVSAIRNSKSGALLIQLVGLASDDSFTGAFDEFADVKLNEIIEDGKLFTTVFRKTRMKTIRGLEKYQDFMVLYIEGASHITSSNLKTKVPLDVSIEDPSPRTLGQYLKDEKKFDENFPAAEFSKDELNHLRENRNIQLKTSTSDNPSADYLWEKSRFGEYISGFSKNETGGSLFVGIRERDISIPHEGTSQSLHYISKIVEIHGARYASQREIEEQLKEKARTQLLVCGYDGQTIQDPDLIRVRFIPLDDGRHVLQLVVRPVRGVVFYDEKGPLAYRIEESRLVEIDRLKWFELMQKI